jgi:hypothetical protein
MRLRAINCEAVTMPATTRERGRKLVRLELPPDIQKQFRIEAAKEGMSMAAMARRVIEEWVAKRMKAAK